MRKKRFSLHILLTGAGFLFIIALIVFMSAQFRGMMTNYGGFSKDLYADHIEKLSSSTLLDMSEYIVDHYPELQDVERLKREAGADWFWDIAGEWRHTADMFNFAYIYYMERDFENNNYNFLMSSIIHRDEHPEWLGTPLWVESTPAAFFDEAWDTKQPTHSPGAVDDEWGSLITAARPILADGHVVGLLCVDYDVSYLEDFVRNEGILREQEEDILHRIGLMFIAAIAIVLAIMAYLLWLNRTTVMVTEKEMEKAFLAEAEERKRMSERISLMLDASPLCCTLRDKDFKLFDCNEEAVRLFKLKDKREFLDGFYAFSPETQPNGRPSSELAGEYVRKAYEEGRFTFEWTHQTSDGELFPAEITLVRVGAESDYTVMGYTRDLREQNRMMAEMEQRDSLLHTVNQAAGILLQSEGDFDDDLRRCMGMIGMAVGADRVCIWKNDMQDGELSCTQVHEWLDGAESQINRERTTNSIYNKDIYESLSRGYCISAVVRDMTPEEQAQLTPQGVLAIFTVPVFIQDVFWGFIGYDNCHDEQQYTETEQAILHSGSLLITNAIVRHEMDKSIRDSIRQKNVAVNSMESILNSIDAMIYATVPDTGELLFVNKFMKEIFGKSDEDLLGAYCYELFREGDTMCEHCPCNRLNENPDQVIVWDEYNDLLSRHIRHSDCYIDWPNGEKVHLQHAVDITELVDAKEQAEQSNRSKGIFLAQMSHEVRTPLNAILGISEIRLRDERLPADAEEGFRKIYDSGNLLLNIINDILDFSKIDAGKMEIVPDRYDIPSLVNDTVQLCRLRYESKPIEFVLQVHEDTPLELIGDELRIRQILNNLLSNAFKYTDAGEVALSVAAEPGSGEETVTLLFRVSDTGQGMRPDQLDRLFLEYVRFNMDENRGISGTGLGMNITKRLIEMMDGTISVESEAGRGTVFTVRLPQQSCGSVKCGPDIAESLRSFSYNLSITKKAQLVHEHMPYGRVLIVDDVESNLYVAKGLMLPYELQIDLAKSGMEAIEKIQGGEAYDIVFMDHMMPKMDGIKATKIIREAGYTRPIVALTANAMSGQSDVFLSNGFDGFIPKPIDSRELDTLLTSLIRDKKAPAVVEQARRARHDAAARPKKALTELEKYVLMDAENSLTVLRDITGKAGALDDEDMDTYTIAAHGVKSALRNIGEGKLSEAAYALEQAGKARDAGGIMEQTPAFIDALIAWIAKYKGCE